MDETQYSLANLRDITVPDPPPFWPLAAGAWVLIAVVALIVCLAAWRWYTAYSNNAYRRAGLALLATAGDAHDVSVIVKRVALAGYKRDEVASLYGKEWLDFLRATGPCEPLPQLAAAK